MDVRGHGNSEGVPANAASTEAAEAADTAETVETADGLEVIHWPAAQPWRSGRVGMFGLSKGGITCLRIAARAPGPLKAVVTVRSADDSLDGRRFDHRFDHRFGHRTDHGTGRAGGSALTPRAYARAYAALAHFARPPDPAHAGQVMWRDMWVKRLETVDPFIRTWPSHPAHDVYGSDGGADGDSSAIRAAVLAVGGRRSAVGGRRSAVGGRRSAVGTTRTATRCRAWSGASRRIAYAA